MRVLPFKSDKDIGVVHGDIKPQNVLVFKDAITRKITVKVADFGYSTLTVGESGKVSCQSQGHGMLPSIISGSSSPGSQKDGCLLIWYAVSLASVWEPPIGYSANHCRWNGWVDFVRCSPFLGGPTLLEF
jgi:serine/threonine protein kinase